MKNIFVLYDYNSDTILPRPMKSNKEGAIIGRYDSIYNELNKAGINPVLPYLDNEISKELILSIKAKNLKYHMAAPHNHRLNPAEYAI